MKDLVIEILDKIQIERNIEMPVFINIDIMTKEDYLSCFTDGENANIFQDFDVSLFYADDTRFATLKAEMSNEVIEETILKWMSEVGIL